MTEEKTGIRKHLYPVVTTLLTAAALGGLLALRAVGLYSHQALALLLCLGLVWAVSSRAWLAWRRRLHPALLRGESRQHRWQALGRTVFWGVVGGVCLSIFPRTGDMTTLLFVLAGIWAARMLAEFLQPQRINWGPTVVMVLTALVLLVDLGRAFAPMPEPVIRLSPPLQGEWAVIQGGQSPLQSHHLSAYNQRYALDMVKLVDGRLFKEGQAGNQAVFSWEATLVSPVDGTVASALDSIEDTEGMNLTADRDKAAGNNVVIETEGGIFVVLAHLRHGSVQVKAGDRVKSGDPLALIGNSGNTTMSHLHIQAQSHADLWHPENRSLPFAFEDGEVLSRNARVHFPTR